MFYVSKTNKLPMHKIFLYLCAINIYIKKHHIKDYIIMTDYTLPYKVANIELAEWGRKEIEVSEKEMPA